MRSGDGKVVSAPFAWQGSSSTDAKSRPYEKSDGDHISAGTGLRDDVGFARPCPIISVVELSGCRQSHCHKWHGNGGGGYGGDALSLRRTELTRDQIIETVACGRPGTGMPYFARGSYDTTKCHEMSRQDVGDSIPPEGGVFLRGPDIDAVADYVLAHIKGKGEPNYDECVSFFGNTSRVCDIYKAGSASPSKPSAEPAK
jgi:hypothetical protein